MLFFQGTVDLIKSVFGRPKPSQRKNRHKTQHGTTSEAQHYLLLGAENLAPKPSEKCKDWLTQLSPPQKRKALDEIDSNTYKRGKVEKDHSIITQRMPVSAGRRSDRDLMPPPSTPPHRKASMLHNGLINYPSHEAFDSTSEARTNRSRMTELNNEYEMEAARRRAAATQLPPNSGVWEPAEQDLFYHLAYRGFEALLPNNWMIDFPTLPLSLFARQAHEVPLIELHRSTDFRGIKALRELMDVGKTARDKALSVGTETRSEPKIERAVNKYVKWGLKDIGTSSKDCIPVYAVAAMQQGQSTRDTIRELTIKMHKLSARHRKESGILTSIEQEDQELENAHTETRLHNDRLGANQQLPVIYGLMICSSLIGLFTLSSHTSPPTFVRRAQQNKKNVTEANRSQRDEEDEEDDNEDSGLRFIASFDFSDSASDVWNAFVIAIFAMMIRKTLRETYEIQVDDDEQDFDESIMDSSLIDAHS